jgi:hypothetical protein
MSAQFHLAQQAGVILSGDYSGEYLPPPGKYGITSTGSVWLNSSPVKVWGPEDNWTQGVPADATFSKALSEANVGYRTAFADAVTSARGRAAPKGGSPVAVNPPGVPTPGAETPFYQKGWFLPVVGVGALGVVLAIAFWPSSKPETAKV